MTLHPIPGHRRAPRRLAFLGAALLAALSATAVGFWPATDAAAMVAPPPAATGAPAAAAAAPPPTVTPPPLPPAREPVPVPPPAPEPTFEQRIDELIAIGQQTARLAREDELAEAQESDRLARQRLSELLQRFADAGERGLALLAGMDDGSVDAEAPARRLVLQVVLAAELARRHEVALANADRSRIDPLVGAVLDVLPQSAPTTDTGARLLVDRPYLRSVHEPAVSALLQQASAGTFPRPVATQLLATLWHNQQASGERTSDELSLLAMLLLDDADPSKRTVACRQLLSDPRYRALALAWLREHGDSPVAAEVAGLAARELAPDLALQVLRELGPTLPRATGAFLVLGARAPELVADAYRDLLAANVEPAIRTELVAAIGLTGSAEARDLVDLALHHDPSPDVRLQAAFAVTATGSADDGERALQLLLDDPTFAGDPTRLDAIVLALRNLEGGDGTNQLDRLARRLRSLPLRDGSRQELDALLARSLPGGLPQAPAGGSTSAAGAPR
ncbi:MAG: hypothetical protein JNL08_02305 [Planctomycetes bacterium]|nr:hypothetical protein [Planctomycetota bacterium]